LDRDSNGQKRLVTDIVADEVSFVDGKNDAHGANDGGGAYVPDAYKSADTANYEVLDESDSLPF
jgi:single-stranded DNA-binding protein